MKVPCSIFTVNAVVIRPTQSVGQVFSMEHSWEWLFRLLREPRRLWWRYAQYPLLVLLNGGQLSGIKRYEDWRPLATR